MTYFYGLDIYLQGTDVDIMLDCTTNQVSATYWRNSFNGASIYTVFYSCKTSNDTFLVSCWTWNIVN